MRDYYDDGFRTAYDRRYTNYENDYPKSDGDRYSYQQGLGQGRRWDRYRQEDEES